MSDIINKTIKEAGKNQKGTIPESIAVPNLFADRYRKTKDRIGDNGGMGNVFVAEDTKLHDTKVVVKVLKLDGLKAPEAWKDRFKREVEIARSLRGNDNIVPVFEYGECKEDARPYMTMEYINDAVDLATYVADKGGRLNEKEICEILKPIAEAIDFAHRPTHKRKAVVHRDIKPANILVQKLPGGRLKPWIIDFGISKSADQKGGMHEFTLSDFAGTLGYIAPEKLAGDRLPRPAQDIFSFAVVLYECLTGRHPFKDADGALPTQVVLHQRMVAGEFKRIEDATPLAKQVMRGLSANPKERPKTCGGFFAPLNDSGSRVILPPHTLEFVAKTSALKSLCADYRVMLAESATLHREDEAVAKMLQNIQAQLRDALDTEDDQVDSFLLVKLFNDVSTMRRQFSEAHRGRAFFMEHRRWNVELRIAGVEEMPWSTAMKESIRV